MRPQRESPPRSASGGGLQNDLHSDYNATPAGKFLSRVANAKETGPGQWICSCPGPLHERGDRNPSLSIKEESDGRLLVCCYAGCETGSIMAALGLRLADLYPAPQEHHKPSLTPHQRKRHGQAMDALRVLEHEARILLVAAGMLRQGEALNDDARNRLAEAEYRIKKALEVAR